jgi:predicted MFS family arabinose efflux permease
LWLILLGTAIRADVVAVTWRIGMIAAGTAVLAAFVMRQRGRAFPIIRPGLFLDRNFVFINLASVIANLAVFSVVLIGPFHLARVAGLQPAMVGLVLAFGGLGLVTGSWVAVPLVRSLAGMAVAIIGLVAAATGLASIAGWSGDESLATMAAPLFIQGVGIGLFQVAYADIVTATLPVEDRGVAGSLTMLTRTIGIVGGATLHAAVHAHFEEAALVAGVAGTAAFMDGFRSVFAAAAGMVLTVLACGGVVWWWGQANRA